MTASPGRTVVRLSTQRVPPWPHASIRVQRPCYRAQWLQSRGLTTTTPRQDDAVPLRKHLKDEAKRKKEATRKSKLSGSDTRSDTRLRDWELTVGIEIHAQLNTTSKLFSKAAVLQSEAAPTVNSHVDLFDAAMPGSQPCFQTAVLLPAIRAALALKCTIQHESRWDRKHYFHWDQPNGYQITQYYQPFAKDGRLLLSKEDGIPAADLRGNDFLTVGIKQIQMEQDTAKTTAQPNSVYHIDLNRSGHPLIEIITLPHIHSPQTAAAVVKKLQAILKSVNACVVGMELGGLRADVNVSVRRRGTDGVHNYSGITGLGQRTEIKNLSSFKAVEDAIIAERDRQISVLEAGGFIEGETRGWTLGATETTRLRGKEGEVDYRYIPDADLSPVLVGSDLVEHLSSTLPEMPDDTVSRVQTSYGMSLKDARTIVALNQGDRLELMEETIVLLKAQVDGVDHSKINKIVSNWAVHELGAILSSSDDKRELPSINATKLADVLRNLLLKQITASSAKTLLILLANTSAETNVECLIEDNNFRLRPLTAEQYETLAQEVISESPDMVAAVRDKGQRGKIMWFVGQMVRRGEEGTIEPEMARRVVEHIIDRPS